MVDRGFTLVSKLEAQGVKLNMPAFTKGKPQLTEQDGTSTRRIAAVRIHVERAINREDEDNNNTLPVRRAPDEDEDSP
ncbi:hypothetical protein HPB47_027608 [Ixodes persulcatus]|uniref:Uncharacterized protein n=1 Tax=Ixodes persulcatus TaxID=34615 RepID=A0AC60PWT0_IXOPE|nr:hypothetical protein HPB47_027608 [Ixodes persulcatus]